MNCLWQDIPNSTDRRGWRRVRCVRCGLALKPTPHTHDRIFASCPAWPLAHEWGYWVEYLLSLAGLTKRRWAWIVAKLGLVEVPAGSCRGCAAREAWLNSLGGRLCSSRSLLGRALAAVLVRRAG